MTDPGTGATSYVRWFSTLGMDDLEEVGGKNASLGEMVSNLSELGVRVPDGFATTAAAYRHFIGDTGLADRARRLIADRYGEDLDADDAERLVPFVVSVLETSRSLESLDPTTLDPATTAWADDRRDP